MSRPKKLELSLPVEVIERLRLIGHLNGVPASVVATVLLTGAVIPTTKPHKPRVKPRRILRQEH